MYIYTHNPSYNSVEISEMFWDSMQLIIVHTMDFIPMAYNFGSQIQCLWMTKELSFCSLETYFR